MSKGEFGEPWVRDGNRILCGNEGPGWEDFCLEVAEARYANRGLSRAVACVNALAGRDPEAIAQRLAERDELLAAAKNLLPDYKTYGITIGPPGMKELASAIAKAEGGRDPEAVAQRLEEREELLAAAKRLIAAIDEARPDMDRDAKDALQAEIAKAVAKRVRRIGA